MSWIKIDSFTPDKPEIYVIAEHLGIDPDAVLGKLVRVWNWADQQTEDGNAPSVTKSLLDRITGVTGFADAMIAAGWLVASEGGFAFPNFERHNGSSAKKRAETARRVAKHKQLKRESNGDSVTDALPMRYQNVTDALQSALPRVEKRRVEKSRDTNTNTLSSVPSERVSSATKKLEPWDEEVFAQFWSRYPRPVGKKVAHTAFTKAYLSLAADDRIPTRDAAQRIVDRATEFAKSSRGKEQQYLPHPSTWLNQGRYLDNPTLWKESADSDGVPSLQEIFGGDFND